MLLAVARALRPVARSVRNSCTKSTVAEAESRFITGHPDCNDAHRQFSRADLHKKSRTRWASSRIDEGDCWPRRAQTC